MPLKAFALVELRVGIVALAGVCAGCGNANEVQRVPMRGKVSLNGVPLNGGSVSLLPDAGNDAPAANVTIERGEYRFDRASGPAAGAYRVLVMHSAGDAAKGKMESFNAGPPPRKREWQSKVQVPAASSFEHDIELK